MQYGKHIEMFVLKSGFCIGNLPIPDLWNEKYIMVDGYIPNISFNIKRIIGGNIRNEGNATVFTRERDIEREEGGGKTMLL